MKVLGRNGLGFTGALAVLPAAGVLFASLMACSAGETTTAPSTRSYDVDDHKPLRVDPPALENGSEDGAGGGPPSSGNEGGTVGKGKEPQSGNDTLGGEN